jgi:translocation and assembly module TamB
MHLSEVVCRAGFARPLERVLTEQRMEQAMVRGNPELRNWLIKAFAFVAVLEIAYLLAGNLLLNGRFLPQMLSRDPDRLSIEWVSAWTLVPGHLRVTGLTLRGQTAQQQWWLSMDYGEARLALGSLFARTFRLQGVQVDNMTAGVRDRLAPAPATDPASTPATAGELPSASVAAQADATPPLPTRPASTMSQPDAAAQTLTPPAAEAASEWSGWSIAVSNAEMAQIQELEVNGYHFSGQARLRIDDFTYRLDGPLAMARGRVQLESGKLLRASELLASDLQGDVDIGVDGFVPGDNPGAGAARFVSGRIGVTGDLTSFGFIDAYLSSSQWLQLDGSGRLQASLRIEHGTLMERSELSIESPDLTLVLDERLASGAGERHLVQGAGRVHGDVRVEQGTGQTRLQVDLRDVAMRRLPQKQLFLHAEGFHLGLTAAPVNLSERPGEASVSMQWREAVMPDIALLNSYLPGGLPFRLTSGKARLNGQLTYAQQQVSGSFELAGEKISGIVFDKSVVGTLAVDLTIKQADFKNRLLDLSGTRIRMQASEQGTAGAAGPAALQTELKLVRAQLVSALSLDELRQYSGQPPLSGEVKLEGTVANIDFLNAFLAQRHALEFGGGGRLQADLLLNDGQLASPSSVTVESDRLVSRFSGFEASGAGGVSAGIRTRAGAEEMRIDMALREMQIRQLKGGAVFLRGKGLQLTATSPPPDGRTRRIEPTAVLTWQDALMPDVALLNSYFPGQPPFSLGSGTARSSGRLDYAGRKLSGRVNLAGENIAGVLFMEPVVGQLAVDLVIRKADPAGGLLDLSGSSVQMQAATAEAAAGGGAPLQTRITVTEARFKSSPLSAKMARLAPLSGVVKLEGSVANIAFLNSFLHGDQGLAFSGDARMTAELRLSEGKVAPGSNLNAESDHLVSRFLDFEASGSGVLKAAIQGDRGAPEARMEGFLKRFGLRRIDDQVPYVKGRDFRITTVGKRFDSVHGLRDLETVITLGSAEIPDISIYNAYLPKEGGVSIGAGKATLAADFRLSGVTGSAKLEMQASGVEVHVKEQTIKGDLRISTRLSEGNLEKMSFDAAGTQLRIDNGSLESEGSAHDNLWWGQIDIDRGRMTWKRPLKLDAQISLRLRDSGLLVHLFVKQTKEQQWLNELLTIRDVSGHSEVHLNDKAIVLSNARISGEKLLVLANLRLREEKMRGGLYASYGILGVGIELKGDERSWKVLNPRQWYDRYSAAFSAE